MEHSGEIRKAVVRKALRREMRQEAIAKEFRVSRSSVQNWIRQSRVSGESSAAKLEKRPQDWTAQERFAALMKSQGLSEEDLGAWCRRHGLPHPPRQTISGLSSRPNSPSATLVLDTQQETCHSGVQEDDSTKRPSTEAA